MLKNGQIDNFQRYSQFASVGEFNVHRQQWLKVYEERFTRSELIGLKQLTCYCVKIIGVANVKIATLLKVLHGEYNNHGISRSTFKRMVTKANEIGMLKTMELQRDNGGQSSNLYIFQRYPTYIEPSTMVAVHPEGHHGTEQPTLESTKQTPWKKAECLSVQQSLPIPTGSNKFSQVQVEPPLEEKLNHHKTKEEKTIQNKKELTKRKEKLDHTYTGDHVPVPFIQLTKTYFDCADTIEEFWKTVKLTAYKNTCEEDQGQLLTVATAAFKQLVRAMKNKSIKQPVAYFYGILMKKYSDLYQQQLAQLAASTPSLLHRERGAWLLNA